MKINSYDIYYHILKKISTENDKGCKDNLKLIEFTLEILAQINRLLYFSKTDWPLNRERDIFFFSVTIKKLTIKKGNEIFFREISSEKTDN